MRVKLINFQISGQIYTLQEAFCEYFKTLE